MDSIEERLRLLGILLAIEEENRFFNSEIESAKKSILINRDFDFDDWGNPETWMKRQWQEWTDSDIRSELNQRWNMAAAVSLLDTTCNSIAGYLPDTLPNKTFQASIGREALRSTLKTLSGLYCNYANLTYAIFQSLKQLNRHLSELHQILHQAHNKDEYGAFCQSLYSRFVLSIGPSVASEYEEMKERHSGEVDREWLEDQVISQLVALSETAFMQQKMTDVTRRAASTTKIIHSLDDKNKDLQKRFYCALNLLCTYTSDGFVFDDKQDAVGEFLYKNQNKIPIEHQSAFFRFRRIIELIQADMATSPAPTPQPSSKPTQQTKHATLQPVLSPFITFQKGAMLSDYHIAALQQYLVEQGWIADSTNPDDFVALFSGKSCMCNITWVGGGVGNLYELFRQIKIHNLITIPGGHGLATVLQKHFVNQAGQYLTGLNSGACAKGNLPIIAKCIRILQQSLDFIDS